MIYLELRDLCRSFAIAWNAQNAGPDTWLPSAHIAMGPVLYLLSWGPRKSICSTVRAAARPLSVDGVRTR